MSPHVHDRGGQPTPFWRAVRELLNTETFCDGHENLKSVVYITSESDILTGLKGGVVKEAPALLAAKAIIAKTHKLSSQQEIEAYTADAVKREHIRLEQEEARKQTTISKPSKESNEQLAGLVGATVQAVMAAQTGGGGAKPKERVLANDHRSNYHWRSDGLGHRGRHADGGIERSHKSRNHQGFHGFPGTAKFDDRRERPHSD